VAAPSWSQPLAKGKSKFLGSAMDIIHSDFTRYWNQITPGNAGKWGSVKGSRNSYNWAPLDAVYNLAIANNFRFKHHTLVWGQQELSLDILRRRISYSSGSSLTFRRRQHLCGLYFAVLLNRLFQAGRFGLLLQSARLHPVHRKKNDHVNTVCQTGVLQQCRVTMLF
jgi:hypothetical protein